MSESLECKKVPGVWGGKYHMIPGTRIPVWCWARHYFAGGLEEARDAYPHLDDERVALAKHFCDTKRNVVLREARRYEREAREMERALLRRKVEESADRIEALLPPPEEER